MILCQSECTFKPAQTSQARQAQMSTELPVNAVKNNHVPRMDVGFKPVSSGHHITLNQNEYGLLQQVYNEMCRVQIFTISNIAHNIPVMTTATMRTTNTPQYKPTLKVVQAGAG